jgi:hypothetical protein
MAAWVRSAVAALALGALLLSACAIKVAGSVAKPTALEHQLLGDYEELDEALAHASSVRGDLGPNASSYEMIKAEALEQRAVQRYNEDDLLELKRARCIAERLDATIVKRSCALVAKDPSADRRITRLVEEENRARKAVLTWAAHELARSQGRALPTDEDLAELKKTYQRLLAEAALPGDVHEVSPGVFKEVSR